MKRPRRIASVRLAAVAVSTAVIASVALTARASPVGRDTSFDLPLLDGGDMNSDDIFPYHQYTFLVFWDSGCPHCVESLLDCEAFLARHSDETVGVVAIHTDTGEMFDAQRIVEENGIALVQLWDLGGETARNYDVAIGSFSVIAVNREGRIVARVDNPEESIGLVLDNTLASLKTLTSATPSEPAVPAASATAAEPSADSPAQFGFVLAADARFRFIGVDSRGEAARGPYGEDVDPGNNFLYRFELTISRRITRHLRVGALLRTGNEGPEVLESGPKYLGTEYGSAFAELSSGGYALRLGFYPITMTPLTLMRWDWNDNPRTGGTAGCGVCGATAGVLLLKSLEELGPELVFEGGLASYRRAGLETRVFYGIPRRAMDTGYIAYRSTEKNKARYSLEIAGVDSSWRRHDRRTGSYWETGVRALWGWENRRSVDFAALRYLATDPHFESAIVTLDGRLPVMSWVDLAGELIVWNKTTVVEYTGHTARDPEHARANGGLAGAVFDLPASGWRPSVDLRFDYIHLDPGYFTPFPALSYANNREGIRFSGLLRSSGVTLALSAFYKRLRETDVDVGRYGANAGRLKDSVFGASVDVELPSGVGCGAGWMDYGSWRSGGAEPSDIVQKTLFIGARWRAHRASIIEAQYQRITVEEAHGSRNDEALTNLYTVYLSSSF